MAQLQSLSLLVAIPKLFPSLPINLRCDDDDVVPIPIIISTELRGHKICNGVISIAFSDLV